MPETGSANIEVAHHLSEAHSSSHSRAHELLEILEAVVLAMVAIATAWSGYQAALWDTRQLELYGQSGKLQVQADAIGTTAGQERLYNSATVVEWLKAEARGEKKLAALFERRLLVDFRPAFEAWKQTDPLNNPEAPAGPYQMPEYRNTKAEQAARLNQQSAELLEKGTRARQRADDYVRVTVMLATVLLLTAIAQRFKIHRIRVGLAITSTLLLCLISYRILTLPRA